MGDTDSLRANGGLEDWLADPLVQLVMQADNVKASDIERIATQVRLSGRGHEFAPDSDGAAPIAAICSEMDSRYRPGVGIMLLNSAGEVFVGRRVRNGNRTWQMPQGGIDPGESPRDAALRELREEIGTDNVEFLAESRGWTRYDIPNQVKHRAWNGRWQGQQQKWFAMRFLGADTDINLQTEDPEFSAWRWIPADALPYLIVAFKRQVYQEVVHEFRGFQDQSEPDQEGKS
jgi:putative (di)nucleoside polyphosphate hydrolase